MLRVNIWEACLVAVSVDGFNARFTASAALSGDDDGVAYAPISQPAWAAVVQSITPGCVELSCGGQLGTVTCTVRLGLPEGKTLGGRAMEHLTLKKKTDRLLLL